MAENELVVIGAGGHAKVVISAIRSSGGSVYGVYDDNASSHGKQILGVPILGPVSQAPEANRPGVIAIGSNRVRQLLDAQLPMEWATVIHRTAWIDESAQIGPGTVIFAGAIVQPDTVIGRHVILNTGASADHDNILRDYSQVAPGANLGGGVQLGEGAFIGIGASVRQYLSIGAWSTVGGGAMVAADVKDNTLVVGVPAREKS